MQTVQVERGIRIIDSPGVVFEPDRPGGQTLTLRNVIKVSDVADPVPVGMLVLFILNQVVWWLWTLAALIFDRLTGAEMCKLYKLPTQDSPPSFPQFLVQLALMTGRLLKAGVADVDGVARAILRDWNSHKLPFHSEVPKSYRSSFLGQNPGEGDSIVTSGLAPAFTLDGLLDPGPQIDDEKYGMPDCPWQ
jgi:nuclear GTP-binding protein